MRGGLLALGTAALLCCGAVGSAGAMPAAPATGLATAAEQINPIEKTARTTVCHGGPRGHVCRTWRHPPRPRPGAKIIIR